MQSMPQGDRRPKRERSQPSRSRKRKTKKSINPTKLLGPLPLSEAGQRLANLFPNGWDWIYADAPSQGSEVEWETIKKFPLAPVELWSLHQDPLNIIGIRPNATTRWGIIDIDTTSKYHPDKDPEALPKILEALEDIGIVRTLINQSSYSKGLHIYIPLPETMSSFGIAVALKYTIEGAGISLRSGQCETFPNPKRYIPEGQGFSLYNGIRLPMQPSTGFIPLDQDLNPLPWTLEDWLEAFDRAAAHQDIGQLKKAIVEAEQNHRVRGSGSPKSLESWLDRIEEEKQQGWTGPGQTNEKLKLIACEARVFMGMDSVEQLAKHIYQTAQNTPGFAEHSHHSRDLSQRSKDIALWAMRYYWPMGASATRTTGYHSQATAPADFLYHQSKREAAQYRIKEAVSALSAQNQLPNSATARAKAIAEQGHISQQTLYRAANKVLWHPEYYRPEAPDEKHPQAQIEKQPESKTEQEITQLHPNRSKIIPIEKPDILVNKGITQLYKYVGFVMVELVKEALDALALKGQRASTEAIADRNPLEGGVQGGITPPEKIQNWEDLRKSLPLAMQEKIAKAERTSQRKDELAQKRKERAWAKQQQLKLDFAARPQTPEDIAEIELEVSRIFEGQGTQVGIPVSNPSQNSVIVGQLLDFSALITEDQNVLNIEETVRDRDSDTDEGRSPFDWEQQEFNAWYELAQRFGLVSEYRWRDAEYWVYANDRWCTFGEMLGAFSLARLKRYLGLALN